MNHKVILKYRPDEDRWTFDCECGYHDPYIWVGSQGAVSAYAEHVLLCFMPEGWDYTVEVTNVE